MSLEGWLASDKLMNLNKGAFRFSYCPLFTNTCDNDNGIMGLTIMGTFDVRVLPLALEAMRNTQSEVKGLYHRNPGRKDYVNSHDNYVAMATACILLGEKEPFKFVLDHWPILNNNSPGHLNLTKVRDRPSGLHAPSDWGLYSLAAGKGIGWFRTLFLVGKLIFDGYSKKGTHHLNYLRKLSIRHLKNELCAWKRWLLMSAVDFHDKRINDYCCLLGYYHPMHPIHIAAKTRLEGE